MNRTSFRREVLVAGSAALGLLAGCTGDDGDGGTEAERDDTASTAGGATTEGDGSTAEDGPADGDGDDEDGPTDDDGSTAENGDDDSRGADGSRDGEWPTFRGNRRNTGVTAAAGPRTDPEPAWQLERADGVRTSVALVDDVAVAAAGTAVEAVGIDDGSDRWETDLGETITGSPAVTDGAIAVPTESDLVILERDGTERHRIALSGAASPTARVEQARPTLGSSPTVDGDAVYVGTSDGRVLAASLETAEVDWATAPSATSAAAAGQTRPGVKATPAVADGRVYVGGPDGVAALEAADGSTVWHHPTTDSVTSSPAVADGAVFVEGDRPMALEADDGSIRWEADEQLAAAGTVRRQELAPLDASLAIADEVAIARTDRRVVAYDVADGTERWQTGLEGALSPSSRVDGRQMAASWSSPSVGDDVAVVGTANGLVALDLEGGDPLWSRDLGTRVAASPAIGDGVVVVGDDGGTIRALE